MNLKTIGGARRVRGVWAAFTSHGFPPRWRRILPILTAVPAMAAVPCQGPLRIHPENPAYFTDGTKRPDGSMTAVYLTGAHTWNNLVDMEREGMPDRFDFDGYLGFLERQGHNFIRLWAWDSTIWVTRANGEIGKDSLHRVAPLPWARTGPGTAVDDGLKFDLKTFDREYFERLRQRVEAAGRRGMYVSVMLFEGWGLRHGNRGRGVPDGWAWRHHPFHPVNNINGINPPTDDNGLTGQVHTRRDPAVNALQAAYVRKVVDTVNDLDNVLYEVINEGGEKSWDWWVVETIRDHEKSKPRQHPVGLTGHGAEKLPDMLASPADWVSPGRVDGFAEDPPAWTAKKVSLLDTDHVWGVGGNTGWVWKSFLRGHNPIFMDPYDGLVLGTPADKQWEPIRRALGESRRLAERIDLARARPLGDLASTGYCLAQPGVEYVVYQPKSGDFNLQLKAGSYAVEWIAPPSGQRSSGGEMKAADGAQSFKAPFDGDALLYLRRK